MNQLIQSIKILSPEELKKINAYIDAVENTFNGCTVFGDDAIFKPKTSDVRTSSGITIPANSKIDGLLHDAMNRGLQTYRDRVKKLNTMFQYWPVPGSYNTFFGREPIQILRYSPGQQYLFHHDQGDAQAQPEYFRTLSTVLYLNEGFEGGGTEFPHKTFKPKAGHALFFPSNWCYPHSGQEVISGEKRVAVTWWYALQENEG